MQIISSLISRVTKLILTRSSYTLFVMIMCGLSSFSLTFIGFVGEQNYDVLSSLFKLTCRFTNLYLKSYIYGLTKKKKKDVTFMEGVEDALMPSFN